jgi:hypothetical protein
MQFSCLFKSVEDFMLGVVAEADIKPCLIMLSG